MGDTLFGSTETRSTTPVETRGATSLVGSNIMSLLLNGGGGTAGTASPLQRLGTGAALNIGVSPELIASAAQAALASPEEQTFDLFNAMEPFERQETARQVAGVREGFGAIGGRFGRNAATAEARTRGQLAQNFSMARNNALLQAAGQRTAALSSLAPLLLQSQAIPFQSLLQFIAPGAAQNITTQGLAPGLIGAGANLLGAKFLAGALKK